MAADLHHPSPPVHALAPAAKMVTVAVRLFQRQKALLYLLLGFVLSSLVLVVLIWLAGPAHGVLVLAALQFFVLPFAVSFWGRAAYIKPAQCSFTAQAFCLEARDWQYQVAWQDVATYQVAFSLNRLIGAGYQLKLREVQGHTVTVNVLETELLVPDSGLRPDSALAYLSRYIGWHNQQVMAAGQGEPIVYRPSLLCRQTGRYCSACWGYCCWWTCGYGGSTPLRKARTWACCLGRWQRACKCWGNGSRSSAMPATC